MVTTFTYKPSLVRIDAHNFSNYRSNRSTNTYTQTNLQTGPITIHCDAKLSVQWNKNDWSIKQKNVVVLENK